MDSFLDNIDSFEVSSDSDESFATLLDSYDSGVTGDIRSGDKIKGKIIHIGFDSIFVDTGTKTDGVVEKKELLDENGNCPLEIGDFVELYVISATESEVILSKAISGKADIGILRNAFENKTPVDGKVTEVCKGGFHVNVLGKQAFCPVSQMDVKYIENQDDYTSKTFQFLIKRIEGDGKNIVISRKDYLSIDIEKAKKVFFETVSIDSIVQGIITKIMPYGAFVELIPGLEGMVHISQLSWSRVDNPEEIVTQGDKVDVKILSIEDGKKSGTYKISLSMKQATGDPWSFIGEKFHVGDTVTGKVKQLAAFGAFVEIYPGIEGLVHISEMSYTKRVQRPEDIVLQGESVEVKIKEINLDTKRVSLSIKDATEDPLADLENRFTKGQQVEGELIKKEKFGFFIQLESGIMALLPKSKINASKNSSSIEATKIGGTLQLIIEDIDTNKRKITLTTLDSTQNSDGVENWKSYAKESTTSIGSFGEVFQQVLDKAKL